MNVYESKPMVTCLRSLLAGVSDRAVKVKSFFIIEWMESDPMAESCE